MEERPRLETIACEEGLDNRSLRRTEEKLPSRNLLEAFMKKRIQFYWFIGAVIFFLSVGTALNAQQKPPQSEPTAPQAQSSATPEQAQPPATPDQAQPNQTPNQAPDQAGHQAPDSPVQTVQSPDVQSFTGTILKSRDKYVLQDATGGNTYDLDHQDQLQKYENKKVRVHGTLDASGTLIRLQ
jgi:hypothetical protein